MRGGTGQGVLPAAPREPQLPAPEEPPPSAQRPAPSPRRRLRSRSLSPGSSRPSAPGGPFPWPAARGFSGGAALPAPGLAVPSVLRAAAAGATRGARRPGLHRTPILSRTCARPRRPFGRRRGPRGIEDWTRGPGTQGPAEAEGRATAPRPRFSIRKKHAVQPREPRLRRGTC